MDLKQASISIQVKFARFIVYNFFWILFFLFFVIVGLGGYLFLYPKYQLYKLQLNSELPLLEKKLDNVNQRFIRIRSDKIDFSKIKDKQGLQKLVYILPDKKDIANLFLQFDEMARKENFKIINFSISEDFSDNNVKRVNDLSRTKLHKIRLQMSLSGIGYNNLLRLINLLESNLRLMDIESLSFIPNNQGATIYSFMITTYYITQ